MPISTLPVSMRQFTVTIQRPPSTLADVQTGPTSMALYNATLTSLANATLQPPQDSLPSLDHLHFYGIALPVIASLGVMGQLLNLLVLNHKYMRSSSNAYFTALSLADILFLVCIVMAYCPRPLMWLIGTVTTENEEDYQITFAKTFIHVFPVIEISQVLIMLYVLALTVDHYVFVFMPRKSIKWTTRDVAQRTIFMIFGVVVLVHLPNIFKLQVQNITVGGETFIKVCLSTLYLNNFIQIYEQYIYLISMTWIPTVLAVILGIVILVQMRKLRSRSNAEKPHFLFRDGRSNSGVIGTGFMRTLYIIPFLMASVNELMNPEKYESLICLKTLKTLRLTHVDKNWELAMVVLTLLDSTMRCPQLILLHKQYRRTLKKLCGCCKKNSLINSGSPPYKPPSGKRNWIRYQGSTPQQRPGGIRDLQLRAQKLQETLEQTRRTSYPNIIGDYDYGDSQYANPRYSPQENEIALTTSNMIEKYFETDSVRSYVTNPLPSSRQEPEQHYYSYSNRNHRNGATYHDSEEEDMYSTDQESVFTFHPARPNVTFINDNPRVSDINPDITFKTYKGIDGAEMSESWI